MSKLLKTMLGAVALTYCVSAHAKPFTNHDAIIEAKNFNFKCSSRKDKSSCEDDLKTFIKEYQNAYVGDYQAQRNVADAIWKYRDPEDPASHIEACAWSTIFVFTPSRYKQSNDRVDVEIKCDFSEDDNAALIYKNGPTVRERVAQIKKIINARTVHPVDIKEMDFVVRRDHDEKHAGVGWSTQD
ncbi:hypothetical protein GT348_07200 [Aristophania vespae]|uniref:Uncharacterized protein n=1 Tax=Aristophania vespae TaxID=2697033 RepID=A0A6P1NET7_9PROT|nr:hypothetical protein [Aristophania vespae]QHI96049.1 hypothetical protein GT348_07200 [Aristophania vespae]